MAVANDRAPPIFPDSKDVAVDDPPVRVRKIGHQLPVAVAATRHGGVVRVVEAITAKHIEHGFGGVAGGAGRHGMRRQVFTLRSPELDAVAPAKPVGVELWTTQ